MGTPICWASWMRWCACTPTHQAYPRARWLPTPHTHVPGGSTHCTPTHWAHPPGRHTHLLGTPTCWASWMEWSACTPTCRAHPPAGHTHPPGTPTRWAHPPTRHTHLPGGSPLRTPTYGAALPVTHLLLLDIPHAVLASVLGLGAVADARPLTDPSSTGGCAGRPWGPGAPPAIHWGREDSKVMRGRDLHWDAAGPLNGDTSQTRGSGRPAGSARVLWKAGPGPGRTVSTHPGRVGPGRPWSHGRSPCSSGPPSVALASCRGGCG